ncbi:hypothetical protein [Streptomyces sp. DSM 15324]|uniref:hypothetical protein n=1 Tax=Streptomyces sp. DSM 15324 TaxID=1739111 RepID=UPI00131E536B|nr:hypothetical protein [Streptomyces sp. DSM 15324]
MAEITDRRLEFVGSAAPAGAPVSVTRMRTMPAPEVMLTSVRVTEGRGRAHRGDRRSGIGSRSTVFEVGLGTPCLAAASMRQHRQARDWNYRLVQLTETVD